MAFPNPARDNRKHQLQRDLHKIAIEELSESATESDSWFRGNLDFHPDNDDFWRALPRYMFDCMTKPRVMPDSEVRELCLAYAESTREKYRNGR
jgi:hypothetical protein